MSVFVHGMTQARHTMDEARETYRQLQASQVVYVRERVRAAERGGGGRTGETDSYRQVKL